MSDPNQKQPPKADDPLVISAVTFRGNVNIGSYGSESWSLTEAATSQYHGRVRVEPCAEGLRFCYRAGDVYQEITVYSGMIGNVTRVPKSKLKPETIAMLEKVRDTVVRP